MNSKYLVVVGIISLLIGGLAFWYSDVQTVSGLSTGFIAVAAIVFAILGAWMSILKPVDELDAEEFKERSNRINLALQISPALKQATYALAAAIILRLSIPLVQGIGDTSLTVAGLYHPGWEFPALLTSILLALAGACITFLYLFETVILLITLLPILTIESARRKADFYEEESKDPATPYQ